MHWRRFARTRSGSASCMAAGILVRGFDSRKFLEEVMDVEWNDSQPIYRQLRERVVAMILDGVLTTAMPCLRYGMLRPNTGSIRSRC